MRWVMLDTETTGLRVEEGHRLIEIGCIECIDRRITDRTFHVTLNPEREIDEGATLVHGMTWDQLKDKPLFSDIASGLIEFVQGAEVVIHNAEFDRGFLDEELKRAGLQPFSGYCSRLTDSLGHARELHPDSAIHWMRCANVTVLRTITACCTGRCLMPACSPKSTSR